jgi:hypothetical protein
VPGGRASGDSRRYSPNSSVSRRFSVSSSSGVVCTLSVSSRAASRWATVPVAEGTLMAEILARHRRSRPSAECAVSSSTNPYFARVRR